jgi:hypothetical protein
MNDLEKIRGGDMVKAHIWQRRILGVLGLSLPFMVMLIGKFGNNPRCFMLNLTVA